LLCATGDKQKSRKLVASDFLIETKPQEPLMRLG